MHKEPVIGFAYLAILGNWYERFRPLPVAGFLLKQNFPQAKKQDMENEKKKCPQCQTDIPAGAKKCPNCRSDLRSWPVRHKIITGIGVIFLTSIVLSNVSSYIEQAKTTVANTSNPTAPSIAERKKALGIDYVVVDDRSSEMSRTGRNFLAVLVPEKPAPTTEQLKTLGTILRDEYKNEPFVDLFFWNLPQSVAKNLKSYKFAGNTLWQVIQDQTINGETQTVVVSMRYTKNDASGLNQLVIYPNASQGSDEGHIIVSF